jgi:hypothetical protein
MNIKNRIRVIVFIVTFNNISVISGGHFYWWRKPEYPEKTTDLHIADKQHFFCIKPSFKKIPLL